MPSDPPKITGGERIRSVAVKDVTGWSKDNDHQVLTLKGEAPGDVSSYTLTLQADNLDPFFAHAEFPFKARCPSDLDCKETTPLCPPLQADVPPIDYLAKDFL